MDEAVRKAYQKKSETVRWGKRTITLDLPVDVFSSHQLDVGTRFLLRQMASSGARWPTALDAGCGYGPIALCLTSMGLCDEALGVDRDALAVGFAQWNAQRNGVGGVTFEPGIVYAAAGERRFDLVAANVPAKAGQGVHRLFMLGAHDRLTPSGEVWIVVVKPLEADIDAILDHENVEVRDKASRSGHVVYRYAFRGPVPTPTDPYDRGRRSFRWKSIEYEHQAWHGLPEFDTLSVDTELCFTLLAGYLRRERPESAVLWSPGHGHLAAFLAKATGDPFELQICGRDVLALEATRQNLLLNGFAGRVDARISIDFAVGDHDQHPDLVVGRLNDALGDALSVEIIAGWFADHPDCTVIVGGRATFANRVMQRLGRCGIEVVRKLKRKGFAAARLRRNRDRDTEVL